MRLAEHLCSGSARLRLGLALTFPLLVLLVAHLVFVPTYRTNDDMGIGMLARGATYTPAPTPFLMFSNHALGQQLNLIYDLAPSFPLEWVLPLDDLERFRSFHFFRVGADTWAPFNRERLLQHGIEDIYRAIYENPDVFVIADGRLNRLLREYIHEHYGEKVVPVPIARFATEATYLFDVYRFVRWEKQHEVRPLER